MAKQVNKLICGVASFFIPGLGQLLGGRINSAIFWFVLIVLIGVLLPYAIVPFAGKLGNIILIIAWIMNILDAVR